VIGSISTTLVDSEFVIGTHSGSSRETYLTRPLAVRPVQVLELVSECYDNEVVANRPEVSLRTVEQHFNETYGSIKTVALLK